MNHAQHFALLDDWLIEHQTAWRAKPFTQRRLPWEADWPELAAALRVRTLAQAEAGHGAPHSLDLPAPFPQLARVASRLTTVPDWSGEIGNAQSGSLAWHIPGRKWDQIQHFVQAVERRSAVPVTRWVDWCAGKGHLGRLLARQAGGLLTCLERDPVLTRDGAALSEKWQTSAQHVQADVLHASTWRLLEPDQGLVALHACGDLHTTLLRQGAEAQCQLMAVSPCCYNRTATATYQPLSQLAQRSALTLSRDDLGLPLEATVTAGRRVRQLRDRSRAWRLAFDLWQRDSRGIDEYLPTPSRPDSALSAGMPAFCRDLAQFHGLALPEPADWNALEAAGWQRLAEVANLELLRALFRRPLELWLLLDRAVFLEEQGYAVKLVEFCPVQLTPRNLLLMAERAS